MVPRTTKRDTDAENAMACEIERLHPQVKMVRYSWGDGIDWYAHNGRFPLANIEMTRRYVDSTKYATVFLRMRKWLILMLAAQGLGRPSYHVVQWNDRIGFIDIYSVDGRRNKMGGRFDRPDAPNDLEPVIEIPVLDMRPLSEMFSEGTPLAEIEALSQEPISVGSRNAAIFGQEEPDRFWR